MEKKFTGSHHQIEFEESIHKIFGSTCISDSRRSGGTNGENIFVREIHNGHAEKDNWSFERVHEGLDYGVEMN